MESLSPRNQRTAHKKYVRTSQRLQVPVQFVAVLTKRAGGLRKTPMGCMKED